MILAAGCCLLYTPTVGASDAGTAGLTVTELANQEPVNIPDAYNWNSQKSTATLGESGEEATLGSSAHVVDKTVPLTGRRASAERETVGDGEAPEIEADGGAEIGVLSPEGLIGAIERNAKARANFAEFMFTGAITQEDGMSYVAPVTLAPGQILHTQMDAPSDKSLDYDLYVHEYDAATGYLGARVDMSILTIGSAEVPESVAAMNTAGSNQDYAIIVLSKKGFSATDRFTLHVTLGVGADPGEINDNAFTSYSIGDISIERQSIKLEGTTIDSPYDYDWFSFYVPDTIDFKEVTIKPAEGSNPVTIASYTASGTTLKESAKDGDAYAVSPGYNYIRVSKAAGSFTGNTTYVLDFKVKFYATIDSVIMQLLMDGSPLPKQTYWVNNSEYQQRYAFTTSALFEWIVHYASASGYLAEEVDDTVYASFTDTAWSLQAAEGCREVNAEAKAAQGVAHLSKKVMPEYGQERYPAVSLRYDYDCTMTLKSDLLGTIVNQLPIYITSRIMAQ